MRLEVEPAGSSHTGSSHICDSYAIAAARVSNSYAPTDKYPPARHLAPVSGRGSTGPVDVDRESGALRQRTGLDFPGAPRKERFSCWT